MKRINLFLITATVAVLCMTALAADSLTNEQRFRLAEIEQYIGEQKQIIENYYAARMAEVDYRQAEVQKRLLALEIGDNHKYIREAKFSDWAKYIEEVLRLNGVELSKDKEYARALEEYRRERLWASGKVRPAPKLLAIAEKRLADEKIRVSQLFEMEWLKIENGRAYAIEVQLADLEKKLREQVLNPAEPKEEGIVTGIVYSKDQPTVIVGSRVLHLGDTIGKVRVTAISPDSVEFEKGKKRWTQGVGDEASDQW